MPIQIDAASLGVVLSPGGTRSGYGVGALKALAEYGVTDPKVLIACSGSAGPGMFYLARRYQEMYAWAKLFDDPDFISWSRILKGPMMDIDHLVDKIFRQQAPNLEQEVAQSPTNYHIAVTKLPEGACHWFSRESREPLFEQLRATKTVSGVCALAVDIMGTRFVDGSFSASLGDCIAKAFTEGANQVLLIDNSIPGRSSLFTKTLLQFRLRYAPQDIKDVAKKFCHRDEKLIAPNSRLYICRGEGLAAKHGLTRSSHRLRATIDQGYKDMERLLST